MLNRPLLFTGVLASAVVVPYVLLDKNLSATATSQFNRLTGRGTGEAGQATGFGWPFGGGATAAPTPSAAQMLPGVPPVGDLSEIFRFDITPEWVATRWPRVTTVLAETDLQGLRVPLVTGTHPDDLAGSLTYYFNPQHQLARITFEGYTGDARRLATMCVNLFGMRPAPTLAAGYFLTEHEGQIVSTLQVSNMPIITSTAPTARAEVILHLDRADAKFLPPSPAVAAPAGYAPSTNYAQPVAPSMPSQQQPRPAFAPAIPAVQAPQVQPAKAPPPQIQPPTQSPAANSNHPPTIPFRW
jgi:hypothetical protein